MPAAINPYSMAVAPDWSARNRLISLFTDAAFPYHATLGVGGHANNMPRRYRGDSDN
jgi:hypothetical protein